MKPPLSLEQQWDSWRAFSAIRQADGMCGVIFYNGHGGFYVCERRGRHELHRDGDRGWLAPAAQVSQEETP